jgi:hypothetical protein
MVMNCGSSAGTSEKPARLRISAEDPEQRLFAGEEVLAEIRNIVRDLNTATAGSGRELILAVRLDPESDFCRTIERVSSGNAPARDPDAKNFRANEAKIIPVRPGRELSSRNAAISPTASMMPVRFLREVSYFGRGSRVKLRRMRSNIISSRLAC